MAQQTGNLSAQPHQTTLADRIGMVVGGQFATTLIGLVQGLLFVRLLSKGDYGTFAFVMMLYATGRDLGMLYIPESLLYFSPTVTKGQIQGLVRQSMRLLLMLGLFVALILGLLTLAPDVFLEGRKGLTILLLILGLTSIIGFPGSVYGNLFIATDNHRRAASISLFMTVLGAAGALIPAALGWPIHTILGIMAGTMVVRLALCEWLYRQIFQDVPPEPFPGGIRAQLKYVLPLAATRFAGIFNQKLDKFIIGLFFTAEAFAEFAIGSQELPLVSILPYTIASTMLPKLVELTKKAASFQSGAREAIQLWHTGIQKAAIVMVPVGIFLIVCAEPIMVVLYGERYRPAAVPFQIYSALLPLRVTGYGVMLMAFNRTPELMRIQIGGMAVNIAINYFMLPRIGMVAAPLAAVLTQTSMIVMILVRIQHFAKVGLRGIFPWRHYGRVVLSTVISVAPLVAAGIWLKRDHPIVFLVAGLPVSLALYLIMATWTNVIGAEDRAYIKRWIRLEPLRNKPPPKDAQSS